MTTWTMRKRVELAVAHLLPNHKGKCKRLHGHNLVVDISLTAKHLNDEGMVADFGDVKELLDSLFDHRCLNDLKPFGQGLDPTSENLAAHIAELLLARFANVDMVAVEVSESSSSSVLVTMER